MKQSQNNSKPAVLAILFLLFVLPGCLALLLFQNPDWISGKTNNHGKFIRPYIKLDSLSQHNQWHILLISNQTCGDQCLNLLDKLGRVRLALGRLSRDVDLRLMVTKKSLLPNDTTRSQMKEMAMASQVLTPKEQRHLSDRGCLQGVFIVDPNGYMVLSYPSDVPQKSIFEDLKHLIKVAKQ